MFSHLRCLFSVTVFFCVCHFRARFCLVCVVSLWQQIAATPNYFHNWLLSQCLSRTWHIARQSYVLTCHTAFLSPTHLFSYASGSQVFSAPDLCQCHLAWSSFCFWSSFLSIPSPHYIIPWVIPTLMLCLCCSSYFLSISSPYICRMSRLFLASLRLSFDRNKTRKISPLMKHVLSRSALAVVFLSLLSPVKGN